MKAARAEFESLLAQVIQYLNALLVVSPDAALEQTAQYIQQDMNKTEQQYQQGRKHGKGKVTSAEDEHTDGELHRWEYKADGTYTYYVKDGDQWVASANTLNEYD